RDALINFLIQAFSFHTYAPYFHINKHVSDLIFFLLFQPPPISTLFPYTTLFRSQAGRAHGCFPLAVPGVRDRESRGGPAPGESQDRKSTRLNSSHSQISYAVFCLKKKKNRCDDLESRGDHTSDDFGQCYYGVYDL